MNPYVLPNRRALAFIALLSVTLAAVGCDTKKAERAALLNKIRAVETEVSKMKDEQVRVYTEIEAFTSEIKDQSASIQQHSQRRTKLQDDLSVYVLDHKMTTAALMVTAGSVAGIVNDNVKKESKDALTVVAVLGVVYCIANGEECADVTAHVTYFGSQIEAERKAITDLTSQISMNKSSLQERQNRQASLADTIARKSGERDSLQQQHDSLVCKFCL